MEFGKIKLENKDLFLDKLEEIYMYSKRLIDESEKNLYIPACIKDKKDYREKVIRGLNLIHRLSKMIIDDISNRSNDEDFFNRFSNNITTLNEFVMEILLNYIEDKKIIKGLNKIIFDINIIMSTFIKSVNEKCDCNI